MDNKELKVMMQNRLYEMFRFEHLDIAMMIMIKKFLYAELAYLAYLKQITYCVNVICDYSNNSQESLDKKCVVVDVLLQDYGFRLEMGPTPAPISWPMIERENRLDVAA